MNDVMAIFGWAVNAVGGCLALGYGGHQILNWWMNRQLIKEQSEHLTYEAAAINGISHVVSRVESVIREESAKQLLVLKAIAEKLDVQTQAFAETKAAVFAGIPVSLNEPEVVEKRHQMMLARLDALVYSQEAAAKSLRKSMEMVFGGPGYSAGDDETASLKERAEKLQKRYRLTWSEALQQAQASQVYEGNDGMRERV